MLHGTQYQTKHIKLGDERRLPLDPTRPANPLTNPIQRRTWRVIGFGGQGLRHCVIIEPVGCDGYKPGPRLLAWQWWEMNQ